ncbi:MAG: hypothetical protein ACRCUT_09340, partial [Spirochaetota bacterium]
MLNPNSVGGLSPIILSVLIAVFLLMKSRDQAMRFFSLYFAAAAVFHCGLFITYSVYRPAGAAGWIPVALSPFGMVFLIQFAYRFPIRMTGLESKT